MHTPESAALRVARLHALRAQAGREGERFEVSLGGRVSGPDDLRRWEDAGVDRLVVSPWQRSREAVESLRRYADLVFA